MYVAEQGLLKKLMVAAAVSEPQHAIICCLLGHFDNCPKLNVECEPADAMTSKLLSSVGPIPELNDTRGRNFLFQARTTVQHQTECTVLPSVSLAKMATNAGE